MTTEHARTTRAGTEGLAAAWAVLVGMGGTSATYNVWHAVHSGALNIVLALLYGLAPVLAAAALSHIVAVYDSSKVMRCVTFLVMLGAMALSIGATASVVKPAAGSWMQWLFGAVIDAASLVALRVILGSRSRKNQAAAEMEAARTEAQTALAGARAVAVERSRLEAELATVRAELGAELDRVRAELEAERLRVSARKPARRSGRKRTGNPVRVSASATGQVSGAEDDIDAEAAALNLWLADPSIPGSKLGPMVGRTDSWGRGVVRKWKAEAPESDPQERS